MITSTSFERSVHRWAPWLKAMEDARLDLAASKVADAWDYAGKVLLSLGLPRKAVLRVYFLSCVFSSYRYGSDFVFSEIKMLPPDKVKIPGSSVAKQGGYWRPVPPAILTRREVRQELHQWSGDLMRSLCRDRFIYLSREHPVCQLGSRMKRFTDPSKALLAARMKKYGLTLREINERFGWKPQKGSYCVKDGKKGAYRKRNRFPTARRYVRLGSEYLTGPPREPAVLEFLPDSPEQIASTIEAAGIKEIIDQAFRTAIVRSRSACI